MRLSGKQNSLFPSGAHIKCILLYTNSQSSPFHVFHWSRVYHVRVTKLDCLPRISARQRVVHR